MFPSIEPNLEIITNFDFMEGAVHSSTAHTITYLHDKIICLLLPSIDQCYKIVTHKSVYLP